MTLIKSLSKIHCHSRMAITRLDVKYFKRQNSYCRNTSFFSYVECSVFINQFCCINKGGKDNKESCFCLKDIEDALMQHVYDGQETLKLLSFSQFFASFFVTIAYKLLSRSMRCMRRCTDNQPIS